MSIQICPLCGALPESQHREADCDGNVDAIINATGAERVKIQLLRAEFRESVEQLRREAARVDEITPEFVAQLKVAEEELEEINPSFARRRAANSEL